MVRVEIVQQAQRRRYRDCNMFDCIMTIVEDYPNRATVPYLRAIAHNIAF